jgi:hypothetical protein
MRCVRFRGGPTPPRSVAENRNPGADIAAHLSRGLPAHDVVVRGVKDIEYAHELSCTVDNRVYAVSSIHWYEQLYPAEN